MDYHDFRHTEELFLDSPRSLSPMMTRAYPTYIASAFLTFFHPLRVYLTLNLFAWVLGAVSFVYVGNRLVKDQGAVKLGLTFFCSAQGLIFYVAQPMMYVFAISGIIIVFAIYLLAFSKKDSSQWKLFGAALGLFSLCYESQPFFFAFLLFAYFRKDSLVDIGKSLLLALFVRQVYLISCSQLPFLVIRETLAVAGGGHPVSAIRDLLKHGEWIVLAERFFKSITGYSDCMSHAFQLSLLFAFFGIFFATSSLRRLLLPFFVPGFLTYALFELSQSFYTRFPRLVYSGYPAIYLLAGVGMSQLGSRLSKPFKWIPWALVFIHITWVNLDSFGYPWIYYEWFYRNAGFTR